MSLLRVLRHLIMPPWRVRLALPARTLRAIETAIHECETTHAGEIRFAVESALPLFPLLRGQMARARALEVFSHLQVWDTEYNNGVLIYLLLADHDVEIIADRGVHARVGSEGWEKICREMEALFREGKFEAGVLHGIHTVSGHLVRHYPARGKSRNELDDKPVIL
ncbi:MAG: TPM domain-containing protein [Sulfuricaulis sp.]|nr:TPM domain-containing protein [Sulfuricaulis sp.]